MDTRVELLDAFYQTMRRDKVKIENKNYGFDFINELTTDDVILDYVQMENNFIFTHIQTKDGVLNEENSWKYFSDYIINKTISKQQFMFVYDELVKTIPL